MALIVQKFGGSSVADAQRVSHVAGIIANTYRQGNQVVVVVSAQGKTTDHLIAQAQEVNPNPSKRELDALMATGELASMALMALALERLGMPAISLSGWQAGIRTDGVHGSARIQTVDVSRIRRELDGGKIVVVAGFQGVDPEGDITTLGRGGSDTTAVALAAWLKADRCQIFTDVDGVYDRDPRRYPEARRFGRLSYEAMLALIEGGAQVLHDHRGPVGLHRRSGNPGWSLGSIVTGKRRKYSDQLRREKAGPDGKTPWPLSEGPRDGASA